MWIALRRPLLLLFMLGCVVSFVVSQRLSVRLIADGAISFAFVPFFQVVAFAVTYWVARPAVAFSRALDGFFAGYTPWHVWFVGLAVASALTMPIRWSLQTLVLSAVPFVLWSAHIDYRFFRDAMNRARGAAIRDVVIQRAIGWTGVTVYFLGIAIRDDVWPEIVRRVSR